MPSVPNEATPPPEPVQPVGATRQAVAYLLMALFVALTSVGAFLVLPAAGFIVAGLGCGLYGYLLGAD